MPQEITTLVSVVIPCYNCGRFIEETLQSVLGQTYPYIEIIVVDDGSTDDSVQRINAMEQAARIRLVKQPNAGVSAARNKGIALATGEYIAVLDADDWMYPLNIEKKLQALVNEHADFVYSQAEVTDEQLKPVKIFRGADPARFSEELFVFAQPPVPSPSSVLVRRQTIIDAGLFDPSLSVAADLDMWIRISFRAKVTKVDEPLIRYRLVDGSMNTNIGKQISDLESIMHRYRNEPTVRPWLGRFRKAFYYSIIGNSWHTRNAGRFVKYFLRYTAETIKGH
jgi:glycosyltransferase involved in cell wall biosynthesis